MKTRACMICGKQHSTRTSNRSRKTCSDECKREAIRISAQMGGTAARADAVKSWPCTVCGKPISARGGGNHRLLLCSDECRYKARRRKRSDELRMCACPGCANRVRDNRNQCCSPACGQKLRNLAAGDQSRPCTVCGEMHDRRMGRTKLGTCSEECAGTCASVNGAKAHQRPREIIAPVEILDRPPGHLWRLRDEPPPDWRWSGGARA